MCTSRNVAVAVVVLLSLNASCVGEESEARLPYNFAAAIEGPCAQTYRFGRDDILEAPDFFVAGTISKVWMAEQPLFQPSENGYVEATSCSAEIIPVLNVEVVPEFHSLNRLEPVTFSIGYDRYLSFNPTTPRKDTNSDEVLWYNFDGSGISTDIGIFPGMRIAAPLYVDANGTVTPGRAPLISNTETDGLFIQKLACVEYEDDVTAMTWDSMLAAAAAMELTRESDFRSRTIFSEDEVADRYAICSRAAEP